MSAASLLAEVAALGLRVDLTNTGVLMVRPSERCTPELIVRLKAAKPMLLAYLQERQAEELIAVARTELRWTDRDAQDFREVDFKAHPQWALNALGELLDLVKRERTRTRA